MLVWLDTIRCVCLVLNEFRIKRGVFCFSTSGSVFGGEIFSVNLLAFKLL